MKLKKSERGFTLTELAIVIAVIAVLIAVLVPTFISLINKADNSSDEQTVKNMNTALQLDEAENDQPEYLCQVWKILEDAGYNPAPTPNYSDNQFYWYKTDNIILIYSISEEQFTFPSEYAGTNLSTASTAVTVASTTVTMAKTAITSWTNLVKLDTDADSDDAHNFDNGETTDYVTSAGVVYTGGTKKTCKACGEEKLSGGTKDTENSYTYSDSPLASKYKYDGTTLVGYYIPDSEWESEGEIEIEVPYGTTAIGDGDGVVSNSTYGVFSLDCMDSMYITSISLPSTLTYIGDYAFYGQNKLTSVTIPASVTYIGDYAFAVSAGGGLNTVTFEEGSQLTTIGSYTFYYCNSLTSIELPSSVKVLGEGAFNYCMGLTSITLNEGLEEIGDRAFVNCKISSIVIPESVTSIGYNAFTSCSSLASVIFKNTSDWYVTLKSTDTGSSSDNLSNISTAASYLTDTYKSYYWYRSE